MAENKRVDVKRILSDPDLRRKLMVSTIQATQAREGIQTSEEQAKRAYYVVTEGGRAAFFDLERFRPHGTNGDGRHDEFVRSLLGKNEVRVDVALRDFASIESGPLAYNQMRPIAHLFQEFPPLTDFGETRQGIITGEDPIFIRFWWEVAPQLERRPWIPFSKGGDFQRFFASTELVLDWKDESRSRFHRKRDRSIYFRKGLTWSYRSQRGFSVRILPGDGVHGHVGHSFFPEEDELSFYLLGILNSVLLEYVLGVFSAFGKYELFMVGRLPIAVPKLASQSNVARISESIHTAKKTWDQGGESSPQFLTPWLLLESPQVANESLTERLSAVIAHELELDAKIKDQYRELNDEVFRIYGISSSTKGLVETALVGRPPEVLWQQMEGKTTAQKRMEHVWRLLSYAVKRVVEGDEDAILPFLPVASQVPLVDRVIAELGKLIPGRDINDVEVEIVNELKRKVKGYDRVESIREWLENVYFDFHASLYKSRPIFWHISSKQGKGPAAFSVLVHYHRFDKERMAKLRGVYLRDTLGVFRREAALANQEGRAEDRLEWQAKVEETEELDRRLKQVQEGFHQGLEEFRILTPWKTEAVRPKGWDPDINDGVKVNIEPLQRAGVLRIPEVI